MYIYFNILLMNNYCLENSSFPQDRVPKVWGRGGDFPGALNPFETLTRRNINFRKYQETHFGLRKERISTNDTKLCRVFENTQFLSAYFSFIRCAISSFHHCKGKVALRKDTDHKYRYDGYFFLKAHLPLANFSRVFLV